MKFLREKLIGFLFDSYRELKSEMEYCQGLHRFASSWIRNGSPSNDIGSIFLVPSPLSTKAGRNRLVSGNSSDGRYKLVDQLKSGKM